MDTYKEKLLDEEEMEMQPPSYAPHQVIVRQQQITWKTLAIIVAVLALAFGLFFGGYFAGKHEASCNDDEDYAHSAYSFTIGSKTFVTKPFIGTVPAVDFLQCKSAVVRNSITCLPANPLLTPKDTAQLFLYQYEDKVSLIFTMTGPRYGDIITDSSQKFLEIGNYTLNTKVSQSARIVPMGDEYTRLFEEQPLDGDYDFLVHADSNGCDGLIVEWDDDGLTDTSMLFKDVNFPDPSEFRVIGEDFLPFEFDELPESSPLQVQVWEGEEIPPRPEPEYKYVSAFANGRRRSFSFGANFGFDAGGKVNVDLNFKWSFRRNADGSSSTVHKRSLTGQEGAVTLQNINQHTLEVESEVDFFLDSTTNNNDLSWVFNVRDMKNNRNASLNYYFMQGLYDGLGNDPTGGNKMTLETQSSNSSGVFHGVEQVVGSTQRARTLGGQPSFEPWAEQIVEDAFTKIKNAAGIPEDTHHRRFLDFLTDIGCSWLSGYIEDVVDVNEGCACDTIKMIGSGIACFKDVAGVLHGNLLGIKSAIESCGLGLGQACDYFPKCTDWSLPEALCKHV